MYTEEVNKTGLNNKDDKRIQTFDGIETYAHGTNAFKAYESEMLILEELQLSSAATININDKIR